jgi:excisionase family DNA binding protein
MPRKLYRLAEALEILGIGRTKAYEEMAAGRLGFVQYGARRLFTEEQLDAFAALVIAESEHVAA